MLGKIAAAGLLIGAFGYALWLLVLRRPLPEANGHRGWRWGFFAAVMAFAAWMGVSVSQDAMVTCYIVHRGGLDIPKPVKPLSLSAATRAAWWSLDKARSAELRDALDKDTVEGGVGRDAARLLQLAFLETAEHYDRTHGERAMISCYDMTHEGAIRVENREQLFTRLALLAEAEKKGQLDPETCHRVATEIAQSLAALQALAAISYSDKQDIKQFTATLNAISDKKRPPDAATMEAAALLADLARTAPEDKIKPAP